MLAKYLVWWCGGKKWYAIVCYLIVKSIYSILISICDSSKLRFMNTSFAHFLSVGWPYHDDHTASCLSARQREESSVPVSTTVGDHVGIPDGVLLLHPMLFYHSFLSKGISINYLCQQQSASTTAVWVLVLILAQQHSYFCDYNGHFCLSVNVRR